MNQSKKPILKWSLPKVSQEEAKFEASEILPGLLYLGNGNDALGTINTPNMRNIINICHQVPCYHFGKTGFQYLHCLLDDNPSAPIEKFFSQTFQFIDRCIENNEPVLVHCWAGVSRSATIVIAYLMRKNKWPLETAMDYVKQKRNFINPNHGFLAKLKDFETNHKTK